jgi:hypothetical protein
MRTAGHLLWVGCVTTFVAFSAETAPDVKLFAITQPILRTGAVPIGIPQAVPPPPVDVTLTREAPIELLTQRYEAMTGAPLLYRPPTPQEPAGAYGFLQTKVFNPIVDMESVKVGKAHVTGSIVNAVKKKNPICLLNPFIFAVDW